MGNVILSGEMASVTINFSYDSPQEEVEVGKKVLVVPNDRVFGGREYLGVLVGMLPKQVDVFCDRDDGSLIIGATQTAWFVVVPELHRLFSEGDCCIISFESTEAPENAPAEDDAETAPDDDGANVDWNSQPSASFTMPKEDSKKNPLTAFKQLRGKIKPKPSNATEEEPSTPS